MSVNNRGRNAKRTLRLLKLELEQADRMLADSRVADLPGSGPTERFQEALESIEKIPRTVIYLYGEV